MHLLYNNTFALFFALIVQEWQFTNTFSIGVHFPRANAQEISFFFLPFSMWSQVLSERLKCEQQEHFELRRWIHCEEKKKLFCINISWNCVSRIFLFFPSPRTSLLGTYIHSMLNNVDVLSCLTISNKFCKQKTCEEISALKKHYPEGFFLK